MLFNAEDQITMLKVCPEQILFNENSKYEILEIFRQRQMRIKQPIYNLKGEAESYRLRYCQLSGNYSSCYFKQNEVSCPCFVMNISFVE